MYNLRGGFLVRPLSIALVLGCVGAALSELEESFPPWAAGRPACSSPRTPTRRWRRSSSGGIAASIMTVVSIVFAILLMTLTLASMQFSPRIIVSFVQDRVTQWTLGIFLGTFLLLHGGAARGALPAAPFRAGLHRDGCDAAGGGLRGMAAVLHSPYLARHQRQPYRRPDRRGHHRYDRRDDAMAAPARSPRQRRPPLFDNWETTVSSDVVRLHPLRRPQAIW